ncbi:hypothetical protein [Yinghuangia sp. YIM S09857]|uniref:hypothetical protein n=1 Tax=Yinghuangia sp. YIM S09857 TaxID=3436929 RepID=UPI003F52B3DD
MNTDPSDLERRELLREYREFVKTRHPDRGGDPAEFAAGLVRYRALLSPGGAGPDGGKQPPRASETTVYRRGSLPAQMWRAIMDRHRRKQNPRVQ